MAFFFDTHKNIKKLVAAGMPEEQAEAIVSIIFESRQYDFSILATRDQTDSIQTQISALRDDIRNKINT